MRKKNTAEVSLFTYAERKQTLKKSLTTDVTLKPKQEATSLLTPQQETIQETIMPRQKPAKPSQASKRRVFKQLSNVEHVRLRTGMWLGQNSMAQYEQHFFEQAPTEAKTGAYTITFKEVKDVPAKLKCLDEVCMNAVDEYNRNRVDKSIRPHKRMSKLIVVLHKGGKRITVEDNGRGIPTKNAESVFLHLMYGENFDDTARQEHVAGQNGVGVSLVRIVSKYFYVETCHQKICYRKLFTLHPLFYEALERAELSAQQIREIIKGIEEHGEFRSLAVFKKLTLSNRQKLLTVFRKTRMESSVKSLSMVKVEPQSAEALEHGLGTLVCGTRVTFELDEGYFNRLDVGFQVELLRQYLRDIAMTQPGLHVEFRDQNIGSEENFIFKKGLEDILTQTDYNYYKLVYEEAGMGFRLESFVMEGEGRTLSWVNGNFASLGGSAIEYFSNRLCDEVRKKPSLLQAEKRLGTTITRADVRKLFHVYHVINMRAPRFKSQDKSYVINDLNASIRQALELHLERLIKKINLTARIIEECERRTRLRQLEDASKEVKRTARTYVEKLIPCSSKSRPKERILFLGEGDSAIAGLRSVRDPTRHALFPLRGKPLNVKGLALGKVLQNQEFKNIVAILSLPLEGKLRSLSELNYHQICIVTDADYDGYAIRSLLLNFFLEYWIELFHLGSIFLVEAPLYEVELINARKEREVFYCITDDEFTTLMKKAIASKWQLVRKKRNKGLGETSRPALAYAITHNLLPITLLNAKRSRNIQKLWFAKDEAARRRKEISSYAKLFFEE